MIRFILLLSMMYFAFRFGVIWDSQANPTHNSTVHLQNQITLKGTLSYTWAGDNSLKDAEGKTYIFPASEIEYSMHPTTKEYSIFQHWRGVLPVAVALFFWIFGLPPAFITKLIVNSRYLNRRELNNERTE